MRRILWFRRDLRVQDNPLLSLGGEVLPIFIFDSTILSTLLKEDKRISFIFDTLIHLKKALQKIGLDLKIFYGEPNDIFHHLKAKGFQEVVASGDYDSYAKKRDKEISTLLPFIYLYDTYIFKPYEVMKEDNSPYLVFTPFYNKAKTLFNPSHLLAYPLKVDSLYPLSYKGITVISPSNSIKTLPLKIESIGFKHHLPPMPSLETKIAHLRKKVKNYEQKRDFMALEGTSSLSLELRFGTISIRTILRILAQERQKGIITEPFFRQLVFPDYYAYLLFHFPSLEKKNYRYAFNGIKNPKRLKQFCEAKTGIPIVDAGVQQLLQTGFIHNRVRMILASFFTKHLLLPWQWGETFFAQHLLDYDASSNILSWQWSAGTGIDPQPYFRIFNPYLQSKKFDKEAHYIKKWLPQLQNIEANKLYNESYLQKTSLRNYRKPILQHSQASKEALAYFKAHL